LDFDKKLILIKRLKNIGPGAMVAAAFIGPGTVTTATLAGASYGYTLLWAVVFSIFATMILQEMAARLGVVSGLGLGEAIRAKLRNPIVKIFSFILVVGAILIGNAAYEAGNISGAVLGFSDYFESSALPFNPLIILIGMVAFVVLYIGKYKVLEKTLIFLVSIMGVVFLISSVLVSPNWMLVIKGLFLPKIPQGALIFVIGLIGTTVVPYNLFLHASSVKEKWSGPSALTNSRWDTFLSVGVGGLITMAILITSAAVLGETGTDVKGFRELSEGVTPVLGSWAKVMMAFGFLAAGLSSSITAPLAAAYAASEIMGWKEELTGSRFRLIWMLVLFTGIIFSLMSFRPTYIILLAQVANGLLLPIIAGFLLWVMNDRKLLSINVNRPIVNLFGILVILITLVLGIKGILSALNII
jgi:Mn2+/Fe2+ NRAMP family transporter